MGIPFSLFHRIERGVHTNLAFLHCITPTTGRLGSRSWLSYMCRCDLTWKCFQPLFYYRIQLYLPPETLSIFGLFLSVLHVLNWQSHGWTCTDNMAALERECSPRKNVGTGCEVQWYWQDDTVLRCGPLLLPDPSRYRRIILGKHEWRSSHSLKFAKCHTYSYGKPTVHKMKWYLDCVLTWLLPLRGSWRYRFWLLLAI